MYNFERIHSENNTLTFIPAQLAIPILLSGVSVIRFLQVYFIVQFLKMLLFLYLDDNENQSKL